MKMKRTAFAVLLTSLTLLASGNQVFGQTKPKAAAKAPYPDPAQYGKPFAGVPEGQNATIYHVNMRGFSQDGDFKAVTARLDSIKALGANVVYLMPR